ncbi:PREDICTED: uncharacterized protein LOC104819352 [Tarenaya hassleriana]|uniref:uncharacterized protein LOC104819352 n=1 Tax=Tarenaya hassleriana TaxID=28532 RepID=UPI00053C76CA|nr:PREDICTED: uncharacterized protein LOC104819352 [Tarenaya hassleriana]XP_010547685.1 PREDICTED: uncharacterized protein LOC104819352 [Tarenaya hassleriana]
MGKDNLLETTDCGDSNDSCPPAKNEELAIEARFSLDSEDGLPTCRVCQCSESDRRGDTALAFLGITPPVQEARKSNASETSGGNKTHGADKKNSQEKNDGKESGCVEIVSPEGEVFICTGDIETGEWRHRDALIQLGCSCKNDLALVHYACALKWFINHGSTVCEICGLVAENIKTADLTKIVAALKDYAALRERTADGDPNHVQVNADSGTDPDEVTAIRRQRLNEISSWFIIPHGTSNGNNNSTSASRVISEPPLGIGNEGILHLESRAARWAVEGTGILLATGLLTVSMAWLIVTPHGGKKSAESGLRILLSGLCALTVVIFVRFVLLSRIRYGPARYWAILFVFWFLVFGIWASRSHSAHSN